MGKSLKKIVALALVSAQFALPLTAFAGYDKWEDVPESARKNVEAAWDVAVKEGVSEGATSGMLANANSESAFDPFLQQVGDPAWGFFQMESDRQARLKAFLTERGAMSDPVKASAESMHFVINELKADNMFLTYGLEGDANGTGRYAGPQAWGDGLYRYDVLKYVQGDGKKISASAEEFYKNTDPVKASVEFMVSYERAHSSRDTLHLEQRTGMATAIYEHYSGKKVEGASENSDDSKEDASSTAEKVRSEGGGWVPDENALPNMPKDRDFKDSDETLNKFFADAKSLSAEEGLGIERWKSEREADLMEQSITWTRRFFMLLSLLLLIYPAVLLFAYMFDLWFMFGDSPAMRAVTFGKLAIDVDRHRNGLWFADKATNKRLKVKRMGVGDVLVWSGIFSFVGVLMMGGYIYAQFGNLTEFIMTAVGY